MRLIATRLQHMRILSGEENVVRFTNLSPTSAEALKESWKTENISATNLENGKLNAENVEVTTVGVLELMKKHDVSLEKVCLLDPKAVTELSPEDGGGRFEWFLFGVSLRIHSQQDCLSRFEHVGLTVPPVYFRAY
jgi:hypothetical protein